LLLAITSFANAFRIIMFTILSKITKSWVGLQYTWVATSVGWVLETAPNPNGYQGGVFGQKVFHFVKNIMKNKFHYKFPLFGKKKRKKIFFLPKFITTNYNMKGA
jgi:hypothetical protein